MDIFKLTHIQVGDTMYTLKQLKAIGGSEWQKGNHHRIYFGDLPTLFGLTVERYGTGNVCYAELDGEKISNSMAKRIGGRLVLAKLFYNVKTGEFMGNNHLGDDDKTILVNALKERLEKEDA